VIVQKRQQQETHLNVSKRICVPFRAALSRRCRRVTMRFDVFEVLGWLISRRNAELPVTFLFPAQVALLPLFSFLTPSTPCFSFHSLSFTPFRSSSLLYDSIACVYIFLSFVISVISSLQSSFSARELRSMTCLSPTSV
jgi:hypothetical protein